MPALRYLTVDGAIVRRQDTSLHHIWWMDKWYTPGEQQRFRNLGGHVVRLVNKPHNDLHAETFPPPKPSKWLREQIAEYQRSLEGNTYDQFYQIAHFIGNVANTAWSDEKAHEALIISDNLIAQSTYIEQGRVEPVYARV